jgi:hypothetical protein
MIHVSGGSASDDHALAVRFGRRRDAALAAGAGTAYRGRPARPAHCCPQRISLVQPVCQHADEAIPGRGRVNRLYRHCLLVPVALAGGDLGAFAAAGQDHADSAQPVVQRGRRPAAAEMIGKPGALGRIDYQDIHGPKRFFGQGSGRRQVQHHARTGCLCPTDQRRGFGGGHFHLHHQGGGGIE